MLAEIVALAGRYAPLVASHLRWIAAGSTLILVIGLLALVCAYWPTRHRRMRTRWRQYAKTEARSGRLQLGRPARGWHRPHGGLWAAVGDWMVRRSRP